MIVVAANGQMQRNGTSTYEFVQDSNFFYLTGVNDPNMLLVINNSGDSFLIAGQQTEVGEVFDGAADSAKIEKISGISTLLSYDEGWVKLEKLVAKHKTVYTIEPPARFVEPYSMYTNPARATVTRKLKRAGATIKDLMPYMANLRNIKQPGEVKAIRQAIAATGKTLELIQSNISNYTYEHEIEADVAANFRRLTTLLPAYDSVVASGGNACTMHYMHGTARIDKTKALLLDVGAQFEHYNADITRVFLPKDARINEVFAAVKELQQKAFKIIKPGVDFIDYEREMVGHYGEALKQLGLIDLPLDKNIRKFMPHATSHFLGLDVHDAGDYYQTFKPNMVITVEPGLYINNESIGIRIEDNILLTDDGIEVLSSKIPTELSLK